MSSSGAGLHISEKLRNTLLRMLWIPACAGMTNGSDSAEFPHPRRIPPVQPFCSSFPRRRESRMQVISFAEEAGRQLSSFPPPTEAFGGRLNPATPACPWAGVHIPYFAPLRWMFISPPRPSISSECATSKERRDDARRYGPRSSAALVRLPTHGAVARNGLPASFFRSLPGPASPAHSNSTFNRISKQFRSPMTFPPSTTGISLRSCVTAKRRASSISSSGETEKGVCMMSAARCAVR